MEAIFRLHLASLLLITNRLEIVLSIGFAEELYCGLENCYDVLGINREEFDRTTVSKIYRALAKKHHPDRVKDQVAKTEAEARFRVIATAYETLKDEQTRSDYDYYLDHPEERLYNYYQYYRRKVIPKVDVRLVILGTILSISLFQYYSAKQKYAEAIAYAMTVGKFRNMAINAGLERKVLEVDNKGKLKKNKGKNNEDIIRSIIEENMDVRGGYKKESIYDTLLWHCIKFPYTLFSCVCWYARWIIKYWIRGEEYDNDAKLYFVRKYLGLSENQFNCMADEEHQDMLAQELWIQDNFKRWKAEKDAKEQEKLVQSGRYKRYKRFMKNNAGTISFLDED
ncbi:unnamed protein product [Angiostrongylus costaricensis]|uniref:J domain-containing protein n=1 Tax=Angiostrongylus costaricensis TaxID=334426 RepID=A0A0R3PE24_ANGCS|nr:unnamed protein product [Angiostrongylus costaricensis]